MLTQIGIYNDVHFFGAHSDTIVSIDHVLGNANREDHFLNGDIVDRVNAPKKKVDDATEIMERLHNAYHGRYAFGNHEGTSIYDMDYPWYVHLEEEQVLIAHGDVFMWGEEKAEKYRTQDLGATWLWRKAATAYNDAFRANGLGFKYLDEEDMVRIRDFCKPLGVKLVICGHTHPMRRTIEQIDDIKVLILKRGYHQVDIDNIKRIKFI